MSGGTEQRSPQQPLSFSDHHRQRHADAIEVEEAGEFMVGDYFADGGFGSDGEFRSRWSNCSIVANRFCSRI